ncbi:FAD/NAD(P)-binding protein [Algoriphagus litoralis]|uniref:FAD/NAD(P)-binding protein n=1 Tax=Algoriphagus litoralis TaxID=2202829 RepID=UPI000DB9CC90|nr:FAD/NAD(P)-binding protein [Algoriphagus litoralis]
MIWKKSDMIADVNQAGDFLSDYCVANVPSKKPKPNVFKIGIVGGGPKGLYALDCLVKALNKADFPPSVEIYWFNSSDNFGAGPNFDPKQPDYLLINTCIAQVDGWIRQDGKEDHSNHLNLLAWITKNKSTNKQVQAADYASRALVGCYLQDVAAKVIGSISFPVRLFLCVETIQQIRYEGTFVLKGSTGELPFRLDNILLTTGHCYSNPSLISTGSSIDKKPNDSYLSDIWKREQLAPIPPNSRVGIAGMGLTFIDIVLHLTEGRGGVFTENGEYLPSGNEPLVFPFSRSGQPILPRSAAWDSHHYRLFFLTEDWLKSMLEQQAIRKIDFIKEVLPILECEVTFAYYSTLLGTRNLSRVNSFCENLPDSEKFDLDRLLFGLVSEKSDRHSAVIRFFDETVMEASKGEQKSPLLAAMAVWREAVPLLGQLYSQGGFTGESQRYLDCKLLGALNRTSFGPPIQNIKKIIALVREGIIRFGLGKEVRVTGHDSGKFLLTSKEQSLQVDYLIDARVARPRMDTKNSSLYQHLEEANLAEPFSNEGYHPGSVSMDKKGQSTVFSPQSPPLFFYGSNTEGVYLENDSLSRTRNNLARPWAKFIINQLSKQNSFHDELSF